MTNLCRPKPQEEALLVCVRFVLCMSVLRHSAWLMINLCRPKPQEEALMVCVFSLCVCLCCATLRG